MTTNSEKVPHVHAECIKAWADGAKIECSAILVDNWAEIGTEFPLWSPQLRYRVKPEPKPDVVRYARVDARKSLYFKDGFYVSITGAYQVTSGNLKLTLDGETGKLKSAEAL